MGKRKNSTTTIIVMLFLLVFSLPALAALTTTQIRENSIRINALELKNIDILNSEAPKEMTIVLDERSLNFDFDKSNIRYDAAVDLSKIVEVMKEYPKMKIAIKSHTDSRGSDAYNLALSDRRAKSTLEWMVKQGISRDRLTAKGYGETQLVNGCSNGVPCTEEEHQQNRRSEFIITQM